MKRYSLVALTLAGLCWAAGNQTVYINGQKAAHPLLMQDGRAYVCVEDLKAAGAQVTPLADGLALRFKPDSGGTSQVQAVEGRTGEWLFNGIWRWKTGKVNLIHKPFSGNPGLPGWGVEVEIRNGSTREVSLFQTGVQLPTLALENGTVLKADEGDWQQVSFRNLLPGASVTHQLKFYFPNETTEDKVRPCQRLVIPIDAKFGLLRDTGLRYTAPAPALRVNLVQENQSK